MTSSIRNTAEVPGNFLGKRGREEKSVMPSTAFPKADFRISIKNSSEHPYINWLATGIKKAEGRINTEYFRRLKIDDTICFYNQRKFVLCKVTYLNKYPSFEKMLEGEGLHNMLPFAKSVSEGVNVYRGFPGSDRVRRFGAVAIGVNPIESNIGITSGSI